MSEQQKLTEQKFKATPHAPGCMQQHVIANDKKNKKNKD